jgi:BatD DUF11 like domain
MKLMKFAIIILILSMTNLIAQELRIEIDNPSPRVGHKFQISFTTGYFEKFIINNLPSSIKVKDDSWFSEKFATVFVEAEKAGVYNVGPFEFDFNGKTYKSNSIQLTILDSLALEEGTWINYIQWKDKQLLLIEQQIYLGIEESGSSIKTKEVDQNSLIKLISEEGNLESYKESSYIHPISMTGITYIRRVYNIKNKSGKPVKLRSDSFENLPSTFIIPEIIIEPCD